MGLPAPCFSLRSKGFGPYIHIPLSSKGWAPKTSFSRSDGVCPQGYSKPGSQVIQSRKQGYNSGNTCKQTYCLAFITPEVPEALYFCPFVTLGPPLHSIHTPLPPVLGKMGFVTQSWEILYGSGSVTSVEWGHWYLSLSYLISQDCSTFQDFTFLVYAKVYVPIDIWPCVHLCMYVHLCTLCILHTFDAMSNAVGHLASSHILAIVQSTSMNTDAHIFFEWLFLFQG